MEGFLAVILNMGLIEMPSIEDYWSTSWVTRTAFFSRVFTRDRFESIFWLFHLSHDIDGITAKRIDKVKPLLDLLIPRYQANYTPSRCVAVDETMVGFRGRFGPKQYMPKKPVKYGIKAFTLADSDQGYVVNILLYTGSETLEVVSDELRQLPQPAQVVVHLLKPYLQRGHHVFTDRFYTSIPLAKTLQDKGTAFTGTAVRNRVGLPEAIRNPTRLSDDEVRAFRDGNLLALEWRAAKKKTSVVMLSSDDTAKSCQVISRTTGRQMVKPTVIHHYNQCMNGVDRADQCTVYYSFVRKCKKWWRKVYFWLLEVTVVNSYILFKSSTSQNISHLSYRRQIVDSLAARHIMSAPPRRIPGRPRKRSREAYAGDPERLDGKTHMMGKREPKNCVVCSKKEKRHRSSYFCATCGTKPALCPYPCFEKYHTQANYK